MKKVIASGIIAGAFMVFASPLVADAALLTRELQFGMSGSDVSSLQMFLAKDPSVYPQGLVTGYFGLMTKAAVINFQRQNGIAMVGRVGPVTLAAINNWSMSDSAAPTIYSVNASYTNTSVTLTWTTSENASAIVYYSTSPLAMTEATPTVGVTIGGSSLLVHTDLRTAHSATLTSLMPNTTYYYVVYVRDGAGNETVTVQSTVKTNQ